MKRICLAAFIAALSVASLLAGNRWSVYGGGNISHFCEDIKYYDGSYGWGLGAFGGVGYEINFCDGWSFNPQVEIVYRNNGATLDIPEMSVYLQHSEWRDSWSVSIPLMVGYGGAISDNIGLKFSVGGYVQEAFHSRRYKMESPTEKESVREGFSRKLNVGYIGEVAVETGKHISYIARAQYPILKENWSRNTLTLSLGVRYSF